MIESSIERWNEIYIGSSCLQNTIAENSSENINKVPVKESKNIKKSYSRCSIVGNTLLPRSSLSHNTPPRAKVPYHWRSIGLNYRKALIYLVEGRSIIC